MFYKLNQHSTRRKRRIFVTEEKRIVMELIVVTLFDVAAKTVPNVPCPMNFFNRIDSNGTNKSVEVTSEKILIEIEKENG